jgi:Predicted redox protein, regulator of disulfide bond formation
MPSQTVELRNIPGTAAAAGWSGAHTLIVDRPPGRAGGMGLGFNGAELLAFALGGCFCNDLRYVAAEMGIDLGEVAVTVTVVLEGEPLLATAAEMTVLCRRADGSDAADVVERAKRSCMVGNSLQRGIAVSIEAVPPSA